MMAATRADLRFDTVSFGFLGCTVAAAVVVGWICLGINRERTCALQESPGIDLCAAVRPGSAEEIAALRARIARNPGDANAYTALALADLSPRHDTLVQAASRLAPREPNLLAHRAAAALQRQDWAAAVPPLVELADLHVAPGAIKSLVALIVMGRGPLLEPYLTPGSAWMERVLWQMKQAHAPFSAALPLVMKALQRGVLDPETLRSYLRELKVQGSWADAYALWLSLHGSSLPALFNGSFDRPIERDGFDWEFPERSARSGVIVDRRGIDGRGHVLELQFTGRPIAPPMARQYLFIGPGKYRLHGEYMARSLGSEAGLGWSVKCGSRTVATSPALGETTGAWRAFDFTFAVPPDCGLVASLELATAQGMDPALGGRGRAAFDSLSLERATP